MYCGWRGSWLLVPCLRLRHRRRGAVVVVVVSWMTATRVKAEGMEADGRGRLAGGWQCSASRPFERVLLGGGNEED